MGTSASLLVARLELALGIPTPVPLAGSPSLPSVGHSRGRRVGLVCIRCQKAFTMLLPWMHPSGSVSLPSVWGGCEAGLAKGLGNITQTSSSSCPSQARGCIVAGTLGPS